MSKLGFNNIVNQFPSIQRSFLEQGVKLAQEEFAENFESESNRETGETWFNVVRPVPPPILDVTSKLKNEAINNTPEILGNTAILTIDPIDERGKGYAEYHQEGENQYRDKSEFQREFVTQSEELTEKQVNLLISKLNQIF